MTRFATSRRPPNNAISLCFSAGIRVPNKADSSDSVSLTSSTRTLSGSTLVALKSRRVNPDWFAIAVCAVRGDLRMRASVAPAASVARSSA